MLGRAGDKSGSSFFFPALEERWLEDETDMRLPVVKQLEDGEAGANRGVEVYAPSAEMLARVGLFAWSVASSGRAFGM